MATKQNTPHFNLTDFLENETERLDRPLLRPWPKFLIMESIDNGCTLNTLSPFIIEKAMKGIADVKDVKRLRSGALLIETKQESQARHLLKLESFTGIAVKVHTAAKTKHESQAWHLLKLESFAGIAVKVHTAAKQSMNRKRGTCLA